MRDYLIVGKDTGYGGTEFKYWSSMSAAEIEITTKAAELGMKLIIKRQDRYMAQGEQRYKKFRITCGWRVPTWLPPPAS
jgi:hypothetical protein